MRIGLMGGTFDPIHLAHLVAASEVHGSLNLDQVIFIPAGMPWQKSDQQISPAKHRLEMVKLAIAGDSRFSSNDLEITRTGPTYTIDTVIELKNQNPSAEYFWITGTDVLEKMPTWHKFDQLKDLIKIVAVNRNGVSQIDTGFSYTFVQIPQMQISATEIRNRVKSAKSIKYLVPDAVAEYISKTGLYAN